MLTEALHCTSTLSYNINTTTQDSTRVRDLTRQPGVHGLQVLESTLLPLSVQQN